MLSRARTGAERLARALVDKGIDPAIADLFVRVPRELFVPEPLRAEAYEDRPLPIGLGQTISQPYIVALMIQSLGLRAGERVLEIGTGSGYQTALLSLVAAEVYSVERLPELMEVARRRLEALGAANVRLLVGDGSLGWPEAAPFDGIVVSAAAPAIPEALTGQLAEGGRMIIPVGEERQQQLLRVRRRDGELEVETLCECAFVRLVPGC
jgi:protein-L-isoaspartate(D-aspartate) O-methyltransferase